MRYRFSLYAFVISSSVADEFDDVVGAVEDGDKGRVDPLAIEVCGDETVGGMISTQA